MAASKSPGSGRLPELGNLLNKTPDELLRTLRRFGMEPDIAQIDKDAQRAFKTFERAIEQGVEPDAALWKKIEEQHVKEMTGTLQQMTKDAIRDYKDAKLGKDGDLKAWITREDDSVCESCEPRHGQVKTLAEWRKVGLPGSGSLVCSSGGKRRCRCNLVAA